MKTKDIVKKLLIQKPHLRDSDPKLIATYWFNELKKKNIDPSEINGLYKVRKETIQDQWKKDLGYEVN